MSLTPIGIFNDWDGVLKRKLTEGKDRGRFKPLPQTNEPRPAPPPPPPRSSNHVWQDIVTGLEVENYKLKKRIIESEARVKMLKRANILLISKLISTKNESDDDNYGPIHRPFSS